MVVGIDGLDGVVDSGQISLQLFQHPEIDHIAGRVAWGGDGVIDPGTIGDGRALGQKCRDVDRQVGGVGWAVLP